jgi:1-deoxyxylulose-5-phosphate synthase
MLGPDKNLDITMTEKQIKRVKFGDTGLQVSRLAFGTGTDGWSGRSNQSDLGIDILADLLLKGYEQGITFWDTADAYGTHPHVARALKDVSRTQVTLLTKSLAQTADQLTADVDRFLTELGTDVIDVLLLHALTAHDWTRRYEGAMAALSRAQEQGKVRTIGISCHSLRALQAAAKSDWAEVVMVRINYAGTNMDAAPEKITPLIAKMHSAGKAVFGMKIVGNGRLINDVRGALEYVFRLGTVPSFSLGMCSESELLENVKLVAELDS